MDNVYIYISPEADELQRYAASGLQRYLRRLFNASSDIVTRRPQESGSRFILGLVSAPHVQQATTGLPDLSSQGHIVRRVGSDTVVLAGGSSAAVAWAVYELVERYGVRFLLHGDVFPADPGSFFLPDVDLVLEPLLALRSWRQFSDLPTGPAMWSLPQHRTFIRQLFKLKYNGIVLEFWPDQPFVDYEVRGIGRKSATLLFGQKIPIGADTIGRVHLLDSPLLDNPEMVGAQTFPEMLEAGRRLIGGILEQARTLGMHTGISMQPFEFPLEFRPLLQHPTEGEIQLGGLTCAERGALTNPGHVALVGAHIGAYLDQWSQIDELHLSLPEHPIAETDYRRSWRELDSKYGIEKDFPLEALMRQTGFVTAGGPERADRELKSTVTMLHFLDRFFAENDLLERAASQKTWITLDLTVTSAPLFPLMDRVLWPDAGIVNVLDYTSSRAVRRMNFMESLDATRVRAHLDVTLQDDNIGWMPQVATESIHLLMREMQRLGWRGFSSRCWPIGDLDPVVAYMARASWDAHITPRAAYEDHFSHTYGPAATEGLCQVMRLLEDATIILDLDFLSLFFPVLGIMCRALDAEEPMAVGLHHVSAMYDECRRILVRQQNMLSAPSADDRLAYMMGRLDFAINALKEKELLSDRSVHVRRALIAREAGEDSVAQERIANAEGLFTRAIGAGEAALHAAAAHVRHDSDRASIAAYYHFFVREVRERTAAILKEIGPTDSPRNIE